MNKRIVEFDCARALAMMYIIGFWHLRHYTHIRLTSFPYAEKIASYITIGALCTFTCISAFFLSNNIFSKINDLAFFFKRRFLRLYPLFFVSCCSLYYISIKYCNILKREEGYFNSLKQLVITLLGLGSFVKTAPATIWYASMIIFFYYITPFVLYKIERKFAISIGILVGFYFLAYINFLKWKYITIDSRFFEHYFTYFSILLISYYFREKLSAIILSNKFYIINAAIMIGLLPIAIILHLRIGHISSNFVFHALIIYYGIVFFMGLAKLLSPIGFARTILSFISYTSMVCYLFHRQYFEIMRIIIGDFSVFLAVFIMLSLIIISFFIQKSYDRIIKIFC